MIAKLPNCCRFDSSVRERVTCFEQTRSHAPPDAPPFALPSAAASPACDMSALQAVRFAVVQMSMRLAEAQVPGAHPYATEPEREAALSVCLESKSDNLPTDN